MKEIRWVIQNNLIQENDLKEIQNACIEDGVEFIEVEVTPFSDKLPDFPLGNKENIYYGSTTFMYNLYEQLNKPKGLFYDSRTYSMDNYINKWGEHMLNSDAHIVSVEKAPYLDIADDEDIFIRPDGDGKEFDGQVIKYKEVKDFLQRFLDYESKLDINSKIVVGPAYNIQKEWRNYIVNGEIITSSLYRENFRLKKSATDIPQSMLDFVRDRIKEYSPHKSFAIDIASTFDGTYYIIECGCLNSVGFYHCDINKLVKAINKDMRDSQWPMLAKDLFASTFQSNGNITINHNPLVGKTYEHNNVSFRSKNGVIYSNREVSLKKLSDIRDEKINKLLDN